MTKLRAASEGQAGASNDREPLLEATGDPQARAEPRPSARSRMATWKILLGALTVVLLLIHLLFVALLRKTSFVLDQLTIPDLCHVETTGAVVVEFQNPSYCSPTVGATVVTLAKNGTTLLSASLPGFELQSGVSTVVADVDIRMLVDPKTLHQLAIADEGAFDVQGHIPIHVGCLLVPFTVNVDVARIVGVRTDVHSDGTLQDDWIGVWITTWDPLYSSERLHLPAPRGIINALTSELQRVVAHILKTIVLSNFQVETDRDEIFAFTDVSFEYASRILWNIPSLSIRVQSEARETILLAGMKRFLLGGGNTFISAYTEVFKTETSPIQRMLETYLTGHDLGLHVSGHNPTANCFSLQVLDLVDIKVALPAKIEGKPALLRHYEIHPTLKELDSTAKTCLLELRVVITVNNPLPIRFDLYEIEFDLLYKHVKPSPPYAAPEQLVHIVDKEHVMWGSHEHHNVTLLGLVRRFEACEQVITMYMHNTLAFEIRHGNIEVGAASGNLSIPFSVDEIPIHPSIMENEEATVGVFALGDDAELAATGR